MSDKLFYIDGEWLTYDQAHSLGYTLKKPNILRLYNKDTSQVNVRQDVDDNTIYDDKNSQWVKDIGDINLYNLVGRTTLYNIDDPIEYIGYSDSLLSSSASHVAVLSSITSVDYLYNNSGITPYECQVYLAQSGKILVWYDPVKNKYWNNQDGQKKWMDSPPAIKKEQDDVFIRPNNCDIYLYPQWEEDLSQVPTRYRVSSFKEQDELLDKPAEQIFGYSMVDCFADYQNVADCTFYPDDVRLGIDLYVLPEAGLDGSNGTHYDQGHKFVGDYKYVWIDSEADVDFYRGEDHYIFGQSHDEYNPELFWCSSEYFTYNQLHSMGYTRTKSSNIEIWDSSLKPTYSDLSNNLGIINSIGGRMPFDYLENYPYYNNMLEANAPYGIMEE